MSLTQNNTLEVWRNLKTVAGHGGVLGAGTESGNGANELNLFINPPPPWYLYHQLNPHYTFNPFYTTLLRTVPPISVNQLRKELRKATGPGGISPRLLDCADQLCEGHTERDRKRLKKLVRRASSVLDWWVRGEC